MRWIRATTEEAGRRVVVPVSGGSDSALCYWLCTQTLSPEYVVGVFVGRVLRCRDWFQSLGTVIQLPEPADAVDAEIARWGLLLREAHHSRAWLTSSRNRTEAVLGTYSLASRISTYLPLVRLWKSEVMELAARVGVPEAILQSSRRADPSCGRPQEMAEIPFAEVDRLLQVQVGERSATELAGLRPEQLSYLDSIYRRNRFKSELPLCPPA